MTNDEKRIFLAEWIRNSFGHYSWYRFPGELTLEVVHFFESLLTNDQWARYDAHLADVTKARHRKGRRNYVNLRVMISASADERTEALVRMIKEETK